MIRLSRTSKINSDTVTGSLSYINTLVTEAASKGKFSITVDPRYLNNSMVDDLILTYGYEVAQKNDIMGTNNNYVISWR
jgi:hypothetical protein